MPPSLSQLQDECLLAAAAVKKADRKLNELIASGRGGTPLREAVREVRRAESAAREARRKLAQARRS